MTPEIRRRIARRLQAVINAATELKAAVQPERSGNTSMPSPDEMMIMAKLAEMASKLMEITRVLRPEKER